MPPWPLCLSRCSPHPSASSCRSAPQPVAAESMSTCLPTDIFCSCRHNVGLAHAVHARMPDFQVMSLLPILKIICHQQLTSPVCLCISHMNTRGGGVTRGKTPKGKNEVDMKRCNGARQGLRWMVAREQNGDAVGRGHLHLHPAWLQLLTADGQLLYVSIMPPHLVTAKFVTGPIGGTCGGQLPAASHPLLSCLIQTALVRMCIRRACYPSSSLLGRCGYP